MNRTATTVRPVPGARRLGPNVVLNALLVLAIGVVLGIQYVRPDSRTIGVLMALLVAGATWRLDMLSGIGLLVIALPFPRGTTFGNTNFALILLLLVIWLLRVAQRQAPPIRRTPLDVPILGFLIVWIVSFYNLQNPEYLPYALGNTWLLVAGIIVFYLVVSNVRTEAQLQRLHTFQVVTLALTCLVGLYELGHPGGRLIPGWIEFSGSSPQDINTHTLRIGGPFLDYELFAEFAAMNLLLVAFLLVRARTLLKRLALSALFLVTVLVLFSTVTRGAFMALGLALAYMAWTMRRHIRVVPFTILVTAIVGGFLAMNFYVANFTNSGDIMQRLMGTEFKGLVPDDRTQVWRDGWDRWLMHPILGHGPYYSLIIGTHVYSWPHDGYLLIANMVGVVGLAFFVWILIALWHGTRPRVDTLDGPSYVGSYMVVASTQFLLFVVDQVKIDFLRNFVYQFQVWLYFASWTAAILVARGSSSRPATR